MTAMLPRRQSIFHLGEEGGVAAVHHHHHHRGSGLVAMPAAGGVRRPREREPRPIVGLQILARHHHHHHGRHAHAANVVLKPMVRPRAAAVSGSFLKSCSLCRMELSPTKDVYMYRGDQGFCSEECRWQQILVDEARERDANSKERQRRGQAPRHHIPHPHQGRPPRKALAAIAY